MSHEHRLERAPYLPLVDEQLCEGEISLDSLEWDIFNSCKAFKHNATNENCDRRAEKAALTLKHAFSKSRKHGRLEYDIFLKTIQTTSPSGEELVFTCLTNAAVRTIVQSLDVYDFFMSLNLKDEDVYDLNMDKGLFRSIQYFLVSYL